MGAPPGGGALSARSSSPASSASSSHGSGRSIPIGSSTRTSRSGWTCWGSLFVCRQAAGSGGRMCMCSMQVAQYAPTRGQGYNIQFACAFCCCCWPAIQKSPSCMYTNSRQNPNRELRCGITTEKLQIAAQCSSCCLTLSRCQKAFGFSIPTSKAYSSSWRRSACSATRRSCADMAHLCCLLFQPLLAHCTIDILMITLLHAD